MKSATTGVDGDPPAGDRHPRLPGRHELARDAAPPRLGVEFERDGHLPDRAIGADREDDLGRVREVLAGRDVQTGGRPPQVAQLDPEPPRELDELRVVGDELV
jgi:hypothetical protein